MLLIALALGSTSAKVFALDNAMEEGNQSAYVTAFKALDANNDGTLSKSEARK